MRKIILALILGLVMTLGLAACGGSATQKPIDNDSANTATADQTSPETPDAKSGQEPTAVTIEENTVLLSQDGLVITAKELVDDSIWGLGVKVLLENNSALNLGVQCNSLIVNNYMIADLFSASVAAGKKTNETIYLSSSELSAAGINTISDIVFSFHVFEDDSFETLFDTEEIELKTSAYGTVEQPAMDDGKELVNQDGIRIIGRYVEEDSFWGAGVLLFIENKYGSDVIVQCDDMSVNGFMVTPYFSCEVNDGRMALSAITIMSADLEQNGISSVDDIELVFKIIDPDSFDTLLETETIAFSTK